MVQFLPRSLDSVAPTVNDSTVEAFNNDTAVSFRLVAAMTLLPSGIPATRLHHHMAEFIDPKNNRTPVKKKFPMEPLRNENDPRCGIVLCLS
jgi:hypothetical protein